jgi:DNA polymerase
MIRNSKLLKITLKAIFSSKSPRMDNKKKIKLSELKDNMNGDQKLTLRAGDTNLVFGEGNEDANIMFIGEGPGFWEDKKGIPFVGNAGAFLNQLIIAAGLTRDSVFITNVVHHRPPSNRDPLPSEISAYQPYLDQMIEIINPKIIITLGRFSMGKFLPNVRITSVHGKKFEIEWKEKKLLVVPMYHPAAGLRSTDVKNQTIEDFRKLPKIIAELEKESQVFRERTEQMSLV